MFSIDYGTNVDRWIDILAICVVDSQLLLLLIIIHYYLNYEGSTVFSCFISTKEAAVISPGPCGNESS